MEEEGVMYKIECKECEKSIRRKAKFNLKTRMNWHKKDVKYQGINNAIASHVQEINLGIKIGNKQNFENERGGEERTPRKIIESHYINKFKYKVMTTEG